MGARRGLGCLAAALAARALDADLRARGSRLQVFVGDPAEWLPRLAAAAGAGVVRWHRRYEPAMETRDAAIKRSLRDAGLDARSHNGALLFEPWQVATQLGDPHRSSPRSGAPRSSSGACPRCTKPGIVARAAAVAGRGRTRCPRAGACAAVGSRLLGAVEPGEAGAQAALERFAEGALAGYGERRDIPGVQGTSRLSPHLHFGEVAPGASPIACMGRRGRTATAPPTCANSAGANSATTCCTTSRARRRPTSTRVSTTSRGSSPTRRCWRRGSAGRTGIPIVDAGMRELWHTGWMHNRVRMIVGSLLTKHLRAHWWHGARWFWDTLVDADLANNTLGWQWIAGTGADAAPLPPGVQPVLQAAKFDPAGDYIARWVPELAALPAAQRHAPWTSVPRAAIRARWSTWPAAASSALACAGGHPQGLGLSTAAGSGRAAPRR